MSPRQRVENLSRLSPLPLLSSSALDSSPAPESLLHTVLFPTLPQPTVSHLAVHFYLYFTPPISLYCTVNIFQLLSTHPSPPPTSVCLHLCSQPTSAMRRCSCARTEERATRTRSAYVLQSLRGSCANTPAARRAKTATLPLRRTSLQPACCSALC